MTATTANAVNANLPVTYTIGYAVLASLGKGVNGNNIGANFKTLSQIAITAWTTAQNLTAFYITSGV